MAKLIHFFQYSGQIGDLVGCRGPSGHYLRSKARKTQGVPSAKQSESRARFALVADFFTPLRNIVYLGAMAAVNRGYKSGVLGKYVSFALKNAVGGTYPYLHINPEHIRISMGNLAAPSHAGYDMSIAGLLTFTWQMVPFQHAFSDDKVWMVVYDVDNGAVLVSESLRSAGSATVDLSEEPLGSRWLVYMFAAERGLARFSDSLYLGRVVR